MPTKNFWIHALILTTSFGTAPSPWRAITASTPPCSAAAALPNDAERHTSTGRDVDAIAFVRAVDACMGAMHDAMAMGLRSGGSADAAFVAAMIPHHQGAIDMARLVLLHGRDSTVRSAALAMIAEQQAEIELLRAWLTHGRGVASVAAPRATPAIASVVGDTVAPVPVSSRDRVYTADQVSNTVSVIDPSTDRVLGQIRLGNPRPNLLSPLYSGQINVHGLAVSPDGRTLAVVSTGSNAVTFVETATNRVRGTVYVGRNPHEPMFTPNGRELWVAVRGERYVAVIDPSTLRETRRIPTADGPSMVVFRPDGRIAFVDHAFTPELHVIDVATGRRLRTIPVVSPFSPNLAITADGAQVWLTHKDVGKITVVNARTYAVEGVIDTGPVTNHVTFAGPGGGTRRAGASAGPYAYVTVGGENAVKVYTRDRQLLARIPVSAVPHGVWSAGDGTKVYVGLQQGDAVAVIDTRTQRQVAQLRAGQSPQAVVYAVDAVPNDTLESRSTASLTPIGPTRGVVNVVLRPSSDTGSAASASAVVTLRDFGPVDGIDIVARGLVADAAYVLTIGACDTDRATEASGEPLVTFQTDARGTTAIEAVGPVHVGSVLPSTHRCLHVTAAGARSGGSLLTAPLDSGDRAGLRELH